MATESAIAAGLVGKPVPAFDLPASDGTRVKSADLLGKTFVLYFYPKADTPGCTKQACGFRDAIASYKSIGVPVFGISPDPVKDVEKFAKKFDLNFPLLADSDHSVSEKFGVWGEKTFAGNKYMGTSRSTFIVGADGNVTHALQNVKPEGHDQFVLTLLKSQA